MKNNRVLSFLGLASRARKIISGEELVIKGIQNGRISLVIITIDASENTKKKISDKCTYYDVPYKIIFERDELGQSIGKFSRVVVGVTDNGISKQLMKLLE